MHRNSKVRMTKCLSGWFLDCTILKKGIISFWKGIAREGLLSPSHITVSLSKSQDSGEKSRFDLVWSQGDNNAPSVPCSFFYFRPSDKKPIERTKINLNLGKFVQIVTFKLKKFLSGQIAFSCFELPNLTFLKNQYIFFGFCHQIKSDSFLSKVISVKKPKEILSNEKIRYNQEGEKKFPCFCTSLINNRKKLFSLLFFFKNVQFFHF